MLILFAVTILTLAALFVALPLALAAIVAWLTYKSIGRR